ncbi:hypothetical protein [Croceiramulus getboli]|nr:hypothetical protein P8624_12555 [Flavobacteriaceae bacterium YJPT1-3]
MSKSIQLVDSLEKKTRKLVDKCDRLEDHIKRLQDELETVKGEKKRLNDELGNWSSKYETLKTANAMLGSKEYKRETKLKINTLIREIDQCIAHLAE